MGGGRALNLRLKILLQLGLVTTVVFVFYTWLVLRSYRNDYLDAIKVRSSALASLVKKKAEDQISSLGGGTGGLGILTLDLKSIVESNDNVTKAFIFSPDGRILSHSDASKVNTLVPRQILDRIRNGSAERIFKNESSYDTFVPIYYQGHTPVAYVTIGFPAKVIEEKTWAMVWKFILLLILALGVSYGTGTLFVLREIVRPLSSLNAIAGEVTGGNLTLTAEIRSDEFGALSQSFNNMTESLRKILHEIKDVATKLTSVARLMFQQSQKVQSGSSVQSQSLEAALQKIVGLNSGVQGISNLVATLSETSQEASSSILEMTASIQQVEGNALKLKETGEDISTSINQIAVTLKEVAHNVDSLTSNTDETASSIAEINMSIRNVEANTAETAMISQEVAREAEEGMQSVVRTADGMSHIKKAVQETAAVINSLGERSAQIGEILTVIGQVIDQTNLLALNAAIIATQAGEYGKGFSVVAQEIRNLAERTAASTQDIAKLIEAVQTETAKAVSSVDAGLKSVAEGEHLSAQAGRTLEKIGGSSKKALSMVEQIARTTREQAKASLRVTELSEKISHSIHEIARATREQASGSELIQQAVERLKQHSLQVHKATMEQAKGSRQISKIAEDVNSSVTKTVQVIQTHQKESEEILRAIRQTQSLVNDNLAAVKSTMGVVDELINLAAIFNEEVSRFTL